MREAKEVLLRYWKGKSYPIEPYIIAYYQNIEVRLNPQMSKDIGGKLYIENNKKVIEIKCFLF